MPATLKVPTSTTRHPLTHEALTSVGDAKYDLYDFCGYQVVASDGWASEIGSMGGNISKVIYFANPENDEAPSIRGVLVLEFSAQGELTRMALEGIDGFDSPSDFIQDKSVVKRWLVEALQAGPRKALNRLNEEPNGFYATGTRFDFNPRGCQARISKGRLLINYVGAGEPEGIDKKGWLDVSEATSFIDAYGQQIYAS